MKLHFLGNPNKKVLLCCSTMFYFIRIISYFCANFFAFSDYCQSGINGAENYQNRLMHRVKGRRSTAL
jgi:hypothetical protein